MKIVRGNEVTKEKMSEGITAIEYPTKDSDINLAIIEINGRYPKTARVMNQKCKELAHVFEGKGKIFVNDNQIDLEENDQILIEPGEKYYWQGHLKLAIACTPTWYPEQSNKVD